MKLNDRSAKDNIIQLLMEMLETDIQKRKELLERNVLFNEKSSDCLQLNSKPQICVNEHE